ncbi:MAG: hypothetical protein ABSB28_01570 [Candidatus Bathyarchaeia archaeon]
MSLRVHVSQKLERRFRKLAMKRFSYGKGALSKAAEEALGGWVSRLKRRERARASQTRLNSNVSR